MPHNILITGVSGYLGGQLLTQITDAKLPPHGTIYVLVRSDAQVEAAKKFGVEPLTFNPWDAAVVEENIVKYNISIVYWLIDALSAKGQPNFIRALGRVKNDTGIDVHFLHTSGAKIFSVFAGTPTDKPLYDDDPALYDIQAGSKAPIPLLQTAKDTNKAIIDLSEELGVRSYIFAPCIVYGENKSFGNQISIQTVCIVKAAKAAKRVFKVDADCPVWPVCHNEDNAALYLELLRHILEGKDIKHGKHGHYLASSGSVAWDDIYEAMAKALEKRGVIEDSTVTLADDAALEKMAEGLDGPKELVRLQLGGKCTFTPSNGLSLGWKPRYPPEHILENADAEVELILKHI